MQYAEHILLWKKLQKIKVIWYSYSSGKIREGKMSAAFPSAPADIDDTDHIQPGRNHSCTSKIIPALSENHSCTASKTPSCAIYLQAETIPALANHSCTSKIIHALSENLSCTTSKTVMCNLSPGALEGVQKQI